MTCAPSLRDTFFLAPPFLSGNSRTGRIESGFPASPRRPPMRDTRCQSVAFSLCFADSGVGFLPPPPPPRTIFSGPRQKAFCPGTLFTGFFIGRLFGSSPRKCYFVLTVIFFIVVVSTMDGFSEATPSHPSFSAVFRRFRSIARVRLPPRFRRDYLESLSVTIRVGRAFIPVGPFPPRPRIPPCAFVPAFPFFFLIVLSNQRCPRFGLELFFARSAGRSGLRVGPNGFDPFPRKRRVSTPDYPLFPPVVN